MTKTARLPCYGIVVKYDEKAGGGMITSRLHAKGERKSLGAALDAVESFILAAACAGVNVTSPAFVEAVETTVDKVSNEYGE